MYWSVYLLYYLINFISSVKSKDNNYLKNIFFSKNHLILLIFLVPASGGI